MYDSSYSAQVLKLVTLVNCQPKYVFLLEKDDLVGIICRKVLKALEFRRDTGVLLAVIV